VLCCQVSNANLTARKLWNNIPKTPRNIPINGIIEEGKSQICRYVIKLLSYTAIVIDNNWLHRDGYSRARAVRRNEPLLQALSLKCQEKKRRGSFKEPHAGSRNRTYLRVSRINHEKRTLIPESELIDILTKQLHLAESQMRKMQSVLTKAEEGLRSKDQEIGRLKRKVLCTLFLC